MILNFQDSLILHHIQVTFIITPNSLEFDLCRVHTAIKLSQQSEMLKLCFASDALQSDFLAIEMVDQKIRFVWNAGDKTTWVAHDEHIESYFGKTDEKDMWYRVHAEKYIPSAIHLAFQRSTFTCNRAS